MITVIDEILHSCPLTEEGYPLLEYGVLQWEPVSFEASQEFIDEARSIIKKPFKLKE